MAATGWTCDWCKAVSLSSLVALMAVLPDAVFGRDVQRIREFICDSAAVGPQADVGEVEGAAGETVFIRPADSECNFHLFHGGAPGSETKLSPAPGGYQLVSAVALGPGSRLVCASNAVHSAAKGGRPGERTVGTVRIQCWVGEGGKFSPAVTVVAPNAEYAAWVSGVESSAKNTYRVKWVRDFSFQFLNLSDSGRPGTDGTYETTFALKGGNYVVGDTKKLSDSTMEGSTMTVEPWEPTPEEWEEFQRNVRTPPPEE